MQKEVNLTHTVLLISARWQGSGLNGAVITNPYELK